MLLVTLEDDSIFLFISYFNHRLTKIRELRWESGAVLPEKAGHELLSVHEREYFMGYSKVLSNHGAHVDLDLTADLEVCIVYYKTNSTLTIGSNNSHQKIY